MNALRALVADRLTQPSACGSLWVMVHGTECVLRRSGALWLEAERTLVAADLHLEKGSAYAARGQLLPPYDTADTLARLEVETEALDPRVLILLGDSFHDARALDRLALQHGQQLAALARGRTLLWAEGNHDLELLRSASLPGETTLEARVSGLTLRHEPHEGSAPGEIAGHLHPCAKIIRGRTSVRRRAFLTDGDRLVLPAFGAYAGGLNARDAAFASLFARPPIAAALGERRVYPLGWDALSGD